MYNRFLKENNQPVHPFSPYIVIYMHLYTILSPTNKSSIWWYLLTASANEERNISASFDEQFLCPTLPVQQNPTNGTGYCKCVHGYWGAACQNECPGGAADPCYGKGSCDPTNGSCTCVAGANSTDNCQTCVRNWIGADCSVAKTEQGKYLEYIFFLANFKLLWNHFYSWASMF